MKKDYTIFVAIPFDAATKNQYESLFNKGEIQARFPDHRIKFVFGDGMIGPSQRLSAIDTFRAQNRSIHDQFTRKILESDLLIADITHGNENVYFELGIALMQNKNTLRVTGGPLSKVAFDLQGHDVKTYRSANELRDVIIVYLDTFFDIKKLALAETAGPSYCRECLDKPVTIIGTNKEDRENDLNVLQQDCLDFRMRDGAVEAEFKITSSETKQDWFGIFFRGKAQEHGHIYEDLMLGSYLALLRKNGIARIVEYPGARVIEDSKRIASRDKRTHKLRVEVENNEAVVFVDGEEFINTSKLWNQSFGRVVLGAYRSTVTIYSAHMVCRDTIEEFKYSS
jgi:hypothetical protein